ncbi:MAG: hypothetical protein FWD16_06040 [Clostridia bacterium]|nr:hypothetical protein [Clostridia bacterium]
MYKGIFIVLAALLVAVLLPLPVFAAEEGCAAGQHDFVGEIIKQPTCLDHGEIQRTCTRCNDTDTLPIPAGDYHIYEEKVTLHPGRETEGQRAFTCTVCGHSFLQVIPATGERPRSAQTLTPATPGKKFVLNSRDAVIGTVNAGLIGLFALLIVPYVAGFAFIKRQRDRVRRAQAAKEAAAKHYDFN